MKPLILITLTLLLSGCIAEQIHITEIHADRIEVGQTYLVNECMAFRIEYGDPKQTTERFKLEVGNENHRYEYGGDDFDFLVAKAKEIIRQHCKN